MFAPLSAKQQRENIAMSSKIARDDRKASEEERRKEELHQIKLQEAQAKGNQSLQHKEEKHKDSMGAPLGAKKAPTMSTPNQTPSNPEAGPSDTVPTMLTPGEAVIPQPVAQDPQYKPIIEHMVNEGRNRNDMQGYADGTTGAGKKTSRAEEYMNALKKLYQSGKLFTPLQATQPVVQPTAPVATREVPTWNGQPVVPQKQVVSTVPLAMPLPGAIVETKYGNAQDLLRNRGKDLTAAEGYANGTTGIQSKNMVPKLSKVGPRQRKGYADGTTAVDGSDAKYSRMGNPDAYSGPIPPPVEVVPVRTEKQMAQAVVNTPADTAFYSQVERPTDPNATRAEYEKILARKDLTGAARADLQAEYDRLPPATVAAVPMSDSQRARVAAWGPRQGGAPTKTLPQFTRMDSPVSVNPPSIDMSQYKADVPAPEPTPFRVEITGTNGEVPSPEESVPNTDSQGYTEADKVALDTTIATIGRNRQDELEAAKVSAQEAVSKGTPPEEAESWLSKVISSIYEKDGKDGAMFNARELARFAVVAAGGMLTGGSTNGSLRYASRDVLQASDQRHARDEASKAMQQKAAATQSYEQYKDNRERIQKLEGDYSAAMRGNIPPAIRAQADALLQQAKNDPSKYIPAYQAAIRVLNSGHQKDDKTNKYAGIKQGYIGTRPVQYDFDDNGQQSIFDEKTNSFRPKQPGENIVPREVFNDQEKKVVDSIHKSVFTLAGEVAKKSGVDTNKDRDYVGNLQNQFSEAFRDMYHEFDMPPAQFKNAAENTIAHLARTGDINAVSKEGIRKAMLGNGVVTLREAVKDKYYDANVGSQGYKKPSGEALAIFGDKLSQLIRLSGAKVETLVPALEAQWDSVRKNNPELFKAYHDKARVKGTYSPMMLWVSEGGGDSVLEKLKSNK